MPRVRNFPLAACGYCERVFEDRSHDRKKKRIRYCSRSCAVKAHRPWVQANRVQQERRGRATCVVCTATFYCPPSLAGRKVTCSTPCSRIRKAQRQRGALSHRWQGGKTSEALVIRNSLEYRQWRDAVFARDGYRCQRCPKKGGRLTAHHIKSFADFPELRLDVSNGVTLCRRCHCLEHPNLAKRSDAELPAGLREVA